MTESATGKNYIATKVFDDNCDICKHMSRHDRATFENFPEIAYQEVKLSNEVTGVIIDFLVDKGSRVKRGDVLVVIDDEDYGRVVEEMEARYERAVAVRKNAEKDYERKKSLFERSVVSESSHDQDYLTFQTAKAD